MYELSRSRAMGPQYRRMLLRTTLSLWFVVVSCSWVLSASNAQAEITQENGIQVAEDAVAQTTVTLAQVRVPLSILGTQVSEDVARQMIHDGVETQAEIALDAYQNAIMAESAEAAQAAGVVAQAAALAAQAQANVAVARTQVQFLLQERTQAPGVTTEQATVTVNAAVRSMERAVEHAAVAAELVRTAMMMFQQVEIADSAAEARQAAAVVQAVHETVMARTMATGAHVSVVLAYATTDVEMIREARATLQAADDVVVVAEAQLKMAQIACQPVAAEPLAKDASTCPSQVADLRDKAVRAANAALVWTRMAADQARLAVVWARRLGPEEAASTKATAMQGAQRAAKARQDAVARAAAMSEAAAKKAVVQSRIALEASRRAAEAEHDAVIQAAVTSAETAALTAGAEARLAMAQVILTIAQTTEGTSAKAAAAQIAAAEQLQVAVILASQAEEAANWVHAAAAQLLGDEAETPHHTTPIPSLLHELTMQAQKHAQLATSWAQSATGWGQAAISWAQGKEETAVAAEAAAVAAESSATRVQAAVAIVGTLGRAPTAMTGAISAPSLALRRVERTSAATAQVTTTTAPPDEGPLFPEVEQNDPPVVSPSQ